ncbi:MAG: bifunctional phosphopantothenoylcysteine decarboxylase/phosphopantothenate--cysteine ligase CoaBC [Clostridiales bacterium]|nr:bifunctional phosphopantothenoylcysteine decarboxylase/phosphopantothenate--cysteine ligase CoaBC [Clostridiales bacterium]
MLKGKTVVVGVTGSIAAYKSAQLVSALVKEGCDVHAVMTKNALNFINPITFETLTGNKCLTDTFDRNFEFNVTHVSLSQKADAIIVAPASADVIGKMANGIADDMLTTMVLAANCRVIVAPAMNTAMCTNRIVSDNLKKLKDYGFEIIEPAVGRLACGSVGAGKFPDESVLTAYLRREIEFEKDLAGTRVLVTAGPTVEELDPVRFITNRSTGKMGYAVAEAAVNRGAKVTLVSGPVNIEPPLFAETINVKSAEDMYGAVVGELDKNDILIMSAAVADYTPAEKSDEKIKKKDGDMSLELKRTRDILAYAGKNKSQSQVICGFSMETSNLAENSSAKLKSKNCDLIVANNLNDKGAGFGTDTNKITLITADGAEELELMSKKDAAHKIIDKAAKILSNKRK